MDEKEGMISEKMVDEIVDEIIREVRGKEKAPKEVSGIDRRNLMEIVRLRNRVLALENRMEKTVRVQRTESVESERHAAASSEEAKGDFEKLEERVADLQGQVRGMREVLMGLSDELKDGKG